ncbi:MAG: hypothetical protein V2I25_17105 [Woeseiaceae bacterium]|jgi:hypothetical protein|nr:hypothetical protein [Woeseiaceae bacterium]
MPKIVRYFFRFNRGFAIGAILAVRVSGMAGLSAFSRTSPLHRT